MTLSDYDVKNDQPTVEATGMIDSISRRLSLTVHDPTQIAGTSTFTSNVTAHLNNSKSGKIEEIPDLKLQFLLNGLPCGGEHDFSHGKWSGHIDGLEIGRNRCTANVLGHGLQATVTMTVAKKAVAPVSTLPVETDSFVTGLSTLWTQTTFADHPKERAGVKVVYTRDDSGETYEAETDQSGMAHRDDIVVTRPTWFTVVAPTAGIEQTPERLCIVPPPVGVPPWPKRIFYISATVFCVALALMILSLFISSGSTPNVVKLPSDPIERMWATAHKNYSGYDAPDPVQKTNVVFAVRGLLARVMLYAFLVALVSGIACVFNACVAVWRNWKYRYMEDRTGTLPQIGEPRVPQVVQQEQSSIAASSLWQTAYEIAKEIIAEMSVDVAARGIRAFKLPRIVAS